MGVLPPHEPVPTQHTQQEAQQQLPRRRLTQLGIEHAHFPHDAIPYLLQGGLRNRLLRAVEGLQQGGGEVGRPGCEVLSAGSSCVTAKPSTVTGCKSWQTQGQVHAGVAITWAS